MKEFMFSVPQNIIVGAKSLEKLPSLLKKMSVDHVFLISDRGLEKAGTVGKVVEILDREGIKHHEYLDVLPNPSVEIVNEATNEYKSAGADVIVALGGGSPMDVAKAVGVLAMYGGEITQYEGADKVPGKIVPMIAIPTTAGTGSEVTAFSVITDVTRNYKLTVFSYELIPAYALLDSELIMSLPPFVAASTGLDALVHAMESFLSKAANPFTDAMAEKAMALIGGNIRSFVADRSNEEAAENMMIASTFAGIAFAWARLGNVHAMAHPLGGFFHVPHGVANAILLPYVLEYNALSDRGKYKKMYELIARNNKSDVEFTPSLLINEIKELLNELNIPSHLSQVGVTEDKIPEMAEDAMKSGNILVNPRQSTKSDIEALYRIAL